MLPASYDRKIKHPAVRPLYETRPYLEAYAAHTDLRVHEDGPEAAIGGDWEAGGQRQLAFLQAHGLRPEDTLLDVGCGTGRLARQVVPMLLPRHYVGTDLSWEALRAARACAAVEGWQARHPTFVYHPDGCLAPLRDPVTGLPRHFTVVWCYAVCIHLPTEAITALLASLQPVSFARMYFSYKPAPQPVRTGYKQFGCPLSWYAETAARFGFRVQAVTDALPHIPQPMALLMRE